MKRSAFLRSALHRLQVTWPILSGLLTAQAALGVAIALTEGWSLLDGVYFAFVTGMTIGYGDLVPHGWLTKALSILIGLTGMVFTGLVAAIAVSALQDVMASRGAARH